MKPITPDLTSITEGKKWAGDTETTNLIEDSNYSAIKFDNVGINHVWLKDFNLNNGAIEFDAKGKSDPPQNGFMGVSFRIKDTENYDVVYFKTFNFRR